MTEVYACAEGWGVDGGRRQGLRQWHGSSAALHTAPVATWAARTFPDLLTLPHSLPLAFPAAGMAPTLAPTHGPLSPPARPLFGGREPCYSPHPAGTALRRP